MSRHKSSLRLQSRAHPENVSPGQGWEVRHQLQRKTSQGTELYLPEKARNELLAKASGALLALVALVLTWILSILFATRLAHVGLGNFSAVVSLQFLLWTILRQGMSIVALVTFDILYTSTPRGRRRTLSLYGLDAWMSLIITPINIFRGKFTHVLLVLIPSLFSIFSSYATTGLLGRETGFELVHGGTERIHISAAGGGRPQGYVMTGQEFVYNASNGCLARPNNRFVLVMGENKVLIPSIPDIGTYFDASPARAARFDDVPSVMATVTIRVTSDRSIRPTKAENYTTAPDIGDIYTTFEPIDKSSAVTTTTVVLLSRGIYRQIYLDFHYKTTAADILFATFNNGSHINQVFDVRNVSETLPERLSGSRNLSMDSVLDNFIFIQNGGNLLEVTRYDDRRVKNLGLLLAAAFGIRSAASQNWLDGAGERVATVFQEREVVQVPAAYWAVAATVSVPLAIACLLMCIRRPTINGNLVQVVALLERFIRKCSGAVTPNWQKAFAEDHAFEDENMSKRVMLGYAANEQGQREVVWQESKGEEKQSYRILLDKPERVTKDKLSNLYGLLAG